MTNYLLLFLAIVFEISGTLLLPVSQNFTKPLPTAILVVCYIIAIYLLSVVMNTLPVAIVYASWSGLGVFFIATLSYFLFQQVLHPVAIFGMVLIVIGVIIVNFYAQVH